LSIVGDEILVNLFKKQITSLIIEMDNKSTDKFSSIEYYSTIFHLILNLCQRLIKFNFCPYDYRLQTWPVQFSSMNCKSIILSELNVSVNSFDECLYLFDGHFPSLSVLIIRVKEIKYTSLIERNTVNII
jgi:hypothetical protein